MTILPEFGSVFGIGKNIRNIKNYWLWIQAALPNPVIKVMLTTAPTPRNLTHGYFLFYSDSYLEEEKSVTYWPVQIPTYAHFTYEEVELTHFINVRAGVKAESKPQRVNPNSSSYFRVSPCCLFRLTLCWQKEKKVSQSNYVIPVNNDSLKPAFDVLPAPRLSVQEVSLVCSHEVYSEMAFSSAVLGKNRLLTQQTLFLSLKIPLLWMMPAFLMGNRKRVQFLCRTIQAFSQGRMILGKVTGISLQALSRSRLQRILACFSLTLTITSAAPPCPLAKQGHACENALHLIPE